MKTLGILFAALLLATQGLPQPFVEARPTVSSHLLDPSLYPDYARRPCRAPIWATFEGRPQFVALRTLPTAASPNQGLGTVCMPTIGLVSNPQLGEALDELKHRGYYLFDVGGYVPGSVPNQIRVPPETLRLLEEKLGDRFLGFDVGEQDGRYLFTARAIQSPYASDRRLGLPSQVGAGVLAEFSFPLREECIGDTLDIGDPFPDRFGAVFARLEFAAQLLIGAFEIAAFIGDDFAELLECALNLFLRVLLSVSRGFDPVTENVTLGIDHFFHGGHVGRITAGYGEVNDEKRE